MYAPGVPLSREGFREKQFEREKNAGVPYIAVESPVSSGQRHPG
jgi:hypothetical protein